MTGGAYGQFKKKCLLSFRSLQDFFKAVAQDLVIPKGFISKTKSTEAGGSNPPADKNDDK